MSDKKTRWVIEATSNLDSVGSDLSKIIMLLKQQNDLTQQQTTQTLLANQRQRESIEGVTAAVQKQTTATAASATQQKSALGLLKGEYDNLGKTITGITQILAGAFIVSEIKNYVQEVIKAKSAQDLFVVSLENMLKSKVLADEINAKLMAIAIKSPFEIEQIQEVTKKLVGMGVEVNNIIPYITMLGEISAVVGTSKLPLIAKAFTDVMNKGVLMKQEINQFAENGIPLYDLLAKSMGKTRDEVVKLAEAHKITFKDVELALKTATSEGGRYYGQMAAQAQTLAGQVSNMKDKYTLAQAAIGDFFEDTLKGGIATMTSLIHETIGSENAITRSVAAIKAAIAAYISYRAAIITVNSAKTAAAASTAALATTEVAATASTLTLTGAWNALKLAFVANPIGALVTIIGAAISAMYAWEAVTTEVTEAQNFASDSLRKSNKEFEIATLAVMQHAEGTTNYKNAVDALIARYPEYFAGINKEAINNSVLAGVLNTVNGSFQERIRLANLAYKADQLQTQAIALDQKQLEIVTQLRKEYENISKVNPNDEKFLNAIKDQQGVLSKIGNFLPGALTGGLVQSDIFGASDIIAQKKKIEAQLIQLTRDSATTQADINANAQKTIEIRLLQRLNKGEIDEKQYAEEYKKLTQQKVEAVTKIEASGDDKKKAAQKSSLERTLENKVNKLKAAEQTFFVKQDLLDAEEKLAIERAKRQIKSKSDEAERILSIETEYDLKRKKLLESTIDYKMVDLKKLQEDSDKAFQIQNTLSDDLEDLTLHMNGLFIKEEEEKAQRIVELGKEIFEAQKELHQATIALGEMNAVKDAKIWQDKALVVEKYYRDILAKALESAQKQEAIAQAQYDHYLKVFGPDNELTLAAEANLNKTKTASANALREVGENGEKITKLTTDRVIEIAQAAWKVVQMLVANYVDSTKMAAESLGHVADVIDDITEINRKSLADQLADITLSHEQREALIDASLNRETDLVKRKSAMLAMQQQLEDLATRTESTMGLIQTGLNAVVSFAKGDFVGGMIGVAEFITAAFNRSALNQIQDEMKVLREKQRSAQEKIQLIEAEVAARQVALQAELAALDVELEKFRETQAKKKALAEQASSDSQLRLQEDQNFRNRLLDEGEAREIAFLEAARAREIAAAEARNASAEEVADIQNAFNALVALKHQEYEDAKGDKTKQVSLATQEVKAQETDKVNALKEAEGQKSAEVDAQKKAATDDFRNFALAAQGQIYEQQKQLAILEIRMEIAKLKAQKRKLFSNKRALDDAIAEMEGLIGSVMGGGDGGNAGDWEPVPGGGGGGGDAPTGEGGNTQGPQGDSPAPKFHGDTFLRRGKGQPYGLDTIPIMAHMGERIMQAHLNAKIGAEVSNEQLTDGYLKYQKLLDKLPDLSLHINAAGRLNMPIKTLAVPTHIEPRVNRMEVINLELQREIRGLKKALTEKRFVNIHVDGNAVSVSEQMASQKVTYYQTLYNN